MNKSNTNKVLVLTLSSLDNDSRVQKEILIIGSIIEDVCAVSVNGKSIFPFKNIRIKHNKERVLGIPGISFFVLYIKFLIYTFKETNNCTIIHCNDWVTLPIGMLLKFFTLGKIKVVYDAHEYETETSGLNAFRKKIVTIIESNLIKYADNVITVSDSIANEYCRLYSIKKPTLVLNCPPYQEVKKQDLFRAELGIRGDQNIFLYQGIFSKGRGIDLLLQSFKKFTNDKSVIVFMGYGPLSAEIQHEAQAHKTIFFHEAVSPDILLNYTASADYGILFYENSCLNHDYCSPNKMFEYLMSGIPVLTSNLFEMKRLVNEYGVGVVATENTVNGLLCAVNTLLKCDYQQIKKNVIESRKIFNWEKQGEALSEIYDGFL